MKYNLGTKVHFPFHPQLPSVSLGAPGIPDTFSVFLMRLFLDGTAPFTLL